MSTLLFCAAKWLRFSGAEPAKLASVRDHGGVGFVQRVSCNSVLGSLS